MPNLSRLTCSLFTSQIHILFKRVIISPFVKSAKKQRIINSEAADREAEDRRRITLKHCVRFFLDSSVPSYHLPPRRAVFPRGASWWQLPLRRGRWLWRPSGDGASNNTARLNEKGNRGEKKERWWEVEGRVCRSTAGGFLSQHDVTRTAWLGWGMDHVVC